MKTTMALKVVYFLSLVSVALALTPAMAHLLELPNKIDLSAENYLIVQQNYRGWALAGLVVALAFLSTLVLAVMLRGAGWPFWLALLALLCVASTQVVFWSYTYPANRATANWTMLPSNWVELRRQWEYSHATSAALNLVALIALILSVLTRGEEALTSTTRFAGAKTSSARCLPGQEGGGEDPHRGPRLRGRSDIQREGWA